MALPIGGFMPIPLAMMIPFMATQSMVMGDAFGRAFQYGKRKISAMSNEEFNATSLEQQASEMFQSYRNIIPDLSKAISDSTLLQNRIISEMFLILPKFTSEIITQVGGGGTDIKTEIPQNEHAHSVNRPHTHSGTKTIIGTTTSNGITTTHYSDGTTTTSGTAPPTAPPSIVATPTKDTSTFSAAEQADRDRIRKAELALDAAIAKVRKQRGFLEFTRTKQLMIINQQTGNQSRLLAALKTNYSKTWNKFYY